MEVLDRGHYVRYDFSTATKLLEACRQLKSGYGSITNIIEKSKNKKGVKTKLLDFKGVGPKTAEIFLRDINL